MRTATCRTCVAPITHEAGDWWHDGGQNLDLHAIHNAEPFPPIPIRDVGPRLTEGQRVTRACFKLIGFGVAAFLTGRALRGQA